LGGDTGQIRSLDKAMAILELLAVEHQGLPLAEIARRLGYNESTTHHLVATLRRRGFVDQDAKTRAYRFGYKLVGLVNEFLLGADIYSTGIGPIRELRDASGETSYLTVLQAAELIELFKLPGWRPIQVSRPRLPGQSCLHSTASGKTLLAHLPEERAELLLAASPLTRFTANSITDLEALRRELATIRDQGYALDREEHIDGLACVAAPVFDREGTCLATASVAYPVLGPERWREIVPLVTAAAAKISTLLGHVPGRGTPTAGRAVA